MPPKKRIRDFKHPDREFPKYRALIEKSGWAPHLLCDATASYWDGFTVVDSTGQLVEGISESCRKQMIVMLLDDYFGDEAKDAFVDQTRYWQIRDALITWPNQDRILSEGLRVLGVKGKDRQTS